jgi:hypothetical protein
MNVITYPELWVFAAVEQALVASSARELLRVLRVVVCLVVYSLFFSYVCDWLKSQIPLYAFFSKKKDIFADKT